VTPKSVYSTVAVVLAATLATAAPAHLASQTGYRPAPENLQARRWFQDAKFGLFIHWGASSVLGDGEWVMNNRRIPVSLYERLAPQFNPTRFDPAAWVGPAKVAGMRYMTVITKHHDGFALFDSKETTWDIVDRTPYGKDVIAMLADECRRQGLRLFVYYSQLDWHHPDYYPRGATGTSAERPDSGRWERYLDYMDAQLTELFTNYGALGGVWFDGMWDKPEADWRLERTYALIHRLQPAALIGSNHHRAPFPGEDFQMFEKDLPGQHTTGFNEGQAVSVLPLETAETINDSWGFRLTDRNYKSTRDLIRYLVRAAGHNANFLLNIGPMPNGEIQPEFEERLRGVGQWLERWGESIYGTRGGPLPPDSWGVATSNGDKIYVHILDWSERILALRPLERRVRRARRLRDNQAVEVRQDEWGVVLRLPPGPLDAVDEIVVLEMGPAGRD